MLLWIGWPGRAFLKDHFELRPALQETANPTETQTEENGWKRGEAASAARVQIKYKTRSEGSRYQITHSLWALVRCLHFIPSALGAAPGGFQPAGDIYREH